MASRATATSVAAAVRSTGRSTRCIAAAGRERDRARLLPTPSGRGNRALEPDAERGGRDAADGDPLGADEARQRAQRLGQPLERGVAIQRSPARGGGRLAAREPALEVEVPHLEPLLGAVVLG